jgi:hypothetical protein
MSRLLIVQPDPVQAEALTDALRAHFQGDVAVAQSLDEALACIDRAVPDVVLLPTLTSAIVEDYLIAYLSARPGAGHVQIMGLPPLEQYEPVIVRQPRSWFWWRRSKARPVERRIFDAAGFAEDVVAYLAAANWLKKKIELGAEPGMSAGRERRREPRLTTDEVPWLSLVRFGEQQATLLNVSARGALLRTADRPEHRYMRRAESSVREPARLTVELLSSRQVFASGRIIRCVPTRRDGATQYEVAFRFDDSAARAEELLERLHLSHLIGAGTELVVRR